MGIEQGHGEVGKVETPFIAFTKLLDSRAEPYDFAKLGALAAAMVMNPDKLSDGPDPEENLFMPAGYTYFGRFIDHDLTLDTTSTRNPGHLKDPDKPLNDPTNLRSPRFDLDCVHGNGPGDQPYMYAGSDAAANGVYGGATLLIDAHDLARASNGRAIIGDKRNDENSIVNQIQQIFISFHNKVVAQLAAADASLRGDALFKKARATRCAGPTRRSSSTTTCRASSMRACSTISSPQGNTSCTPRRCGETFRASSWRRPTASGTLRFAPAIASTASLAPTMA